MDCSNSAGKTSSRLQNLRRRLWWSAYSLDRLIAPCLGRPLSIPDEVVTTPFPDIEDGHFITEDAFLSALGGLANPNYASHHQFKLRRLQSEIHRTIQSQHALRVTASQSLAQNSNAVLGLRQSGDFVSWRRNMTDRLDEWKWSIPHSSETGLSSCDLLMELGYWQTIITLYRESIRIPEQLVGMSSILEFKEQVMGQTPEDLEVVYIRIFEACQKTIRIYRVLKCSKLINLVHFVEDGIFVAGALFLCTIWGSENIRRSLSFQHIDSMVLMVIAVLDNLSNQNPTARISTAAFKEMGTMTIEYFLSTSDTDHSPSSRSNEIAHVLTPENTAHDTSSSFTSDLIDHWNPQFPSFNISEQFCTSASDIEVVTPDGSPKKDMLADPSPLLLTFDTPDILSQISTGVQNFEDFFKIPASSGELKRDFESAIDDFNFSQDNPCGISKKLQDEQCPNLETPSPGLTDESSKGFRFGWTDSGSPYN
ncbi:hypothetical protein N7520_003107 [Penicillium odoratum]|uniref:uncharacterized protein n=1 Tax=Penicillium odoratum TaxID=1167516 RepID=UPI002548A988|nr:uncharacterized protein N7520_003107 [Penicillium odoratum]KAJ5772578.1 hypothetical protein N7520_003107 [Penicillium odoratum]